MGCGCGATGGERPEDMLSTDEAFARVDGTYALATFPGCEGGHHGQYEGLSVFVVHRLDPDKERLFRREDLALAAEYVKTLNPRPPVEKLPTSSLCSEAVVALYSGRLAYA